MFLSNCDIKLTSCQMLLAKCFQTILHGGHGSSSNGFWSIITYVHDFDYIVLLNYLTWPLPHLMKNMKLCQSWTLIHPLAKWYKWLFKSKICHHSPALVLAHWAMVYELIICLPFFWQVSLISFVELISHDLDHVVWMGNPRDRLVTKPRRLDHYIT